MNHITDISQFYFGSVHDKCCWAFPLEAVIIIMTRISFSLPKRGWAKTQSNNAGAVSEQERRNMSKYSSGSVRQSLSQKEEHVFMYFYGSFHSVTMHCLLLMLTAVVLCFPGCLYPHSCSQKPSQRQNSNILLKIKVLYWPPWFHEEPLTPMEPYHCTEDSL